MTWKKSLWLTFFIMLCVMLIVNFIISRQSIQGKAKKIMGVNSIFPTGNCSRISDAKNNWQGYSFARNLRFFSRSAQQARVDFQKLVRENFKHYYLKKDLALFEGGIYVLQKAGKGYRLFCLFYKDSTNYWADMVSRDSLHFNRLAFERFILNLEIDGDRTSPIVAEQLNVLQKNISPFFMQTPVQLLGMIALICALALFISVAVNIFSGSCPRKQDMVTAACTPGATLLVKGFGRRRIIACCLCREGDFLVIYRFRRPFLRIDIHKERQDIFWEKNSMLYKNNRVILTEDDFQNWRSRFLS